MATRIARFGSWVWHVPRRAPKKVAVAAHCRLFSSFDTNCDILVFGNWLVEITHFAQQRSERNFAKAVEPAAVLR